MGYAGKWRERARARELRAQSWTLQAIADELGVAKGTVSVWVRDVDHVANPRNRGHPAGPTHPMRLKKEAEIAASAVEAQEWVGDLRDRDLAMFALALYAGEGSKRDGKVVFANSDSQLVGCSSDGSAASSTSTNADCGCAYICMPTSTTRQRSTTGAM
jgi:hypothetical protein